VNDYKCPVCDYDFRDEDEESTDDYDTNNEDDDIDEEY
jgi:transposase-like protein